MLTARRRQPEDRAAREEVDAGAPDVSRLTGRPGPTGAVESPRARQGSSWVPRSAPRDSTPGVGRLPARHVVPGEARSVATYRGRDRVEVDGGLAPSEQRQPGDDQRPPAAVDEVGVVEVGVDDLGGSPGRASARARSPSEWVVGTATSGGAAEVEQRRRGRARPRRRRRRDRAGGSPAAVQSA